MRLVTDGKLSPVCRKVIILMFLGVHVGLSLHAAVEDFVTYDEAGNIAAGIAHWNEGAYHLYNVNPPLTKMLAAWPIVVLFPDSASVHVPPNEPGERNEWRVGNRYALAQGSQYTTLVAWARVAGIGWSVAGALVAYHWSRRLFGGAGGFITLAVWTFDPLTLAYSHMVTADMAASSAVVIASYLFSRHVRKPNCRRAIAAGIALGIALLCKFTLLILVPVWVAVWVLRHGILTRSRLWELTVLGSAALLVVNAGYEFRGTCRRLDSFTFVSRTLKGRDAGVEPVGNRFRDTALAPVPVPVPEEFLIGIDVQRRDFENAANGRQNYLRGEWKSGGWWYYYLYALLVKTPVGTLALFALAAVVLAARRGRVMPGPELELLAATQFTILVLVSSQETIQAHIRYVLPAYSLAVVSVGCLGAWAGPIRWKRGLIAAFVGLSAASSLNTHPHSLAYFNEVAGGPRRGPEHLLGSNLDWGQDLLRVRDWRQKNPSAAPIYLAYFNSVSPSVVVGSIESRDEPMRTSEWRAIVPGRLEPGYYAVSVSFAYGSKFAGNYHTLRLFSRLDPVARPGYSIYIYYLTQSEVNVLNESIASPNR